MFKYISRFLSDESGATAIEYAILVAVIATGLAAAMNPLTNAIQTVFQNAADAAVGS
jgi:pilus assembly protein Flp/PilA